MRTSIGFSVKGVLIMAAMMAGDAPRGAQQAPGSPIRIGSRKQLFVDDYVVERMENLKRAMNQPKKHSRNPVLVPDRPWEGAWAHMYGSVIYDRQAKLYKMWYWCGSGPAMRGAYATSRDGIEWEKPELGLVEFQGSKRNNLISWLAMGMIHTPDDPDPGKRYKSIHGRRGAFSADGLNWHVPPESGDIPGDIVSDNVIPFMYDEENRRYVAFGKVNRKSAGYERRSVSVSFSEDFLTWTPVKTILVPDALDDELARNTVAVMGNRVEYDDGPEWHLAQFYGHCGFPYEGIYLGLLWVFDISGWGAPIWGEKDFTRIPGIGGEDGPMYVQLTSSRDLVNWDRVGDRRPFIPLGEPDSCDSGQIYTTNRPIVVDDEVWIYYAGHECTHGHPVHWATETDRFPQIPDAIKRASPRIRETINLAILRLDGWVSVDAGLEKGVLTTKPIVFRTGSKLVINAEATHGAVRAEILDESGKPLPRFGSDDCDAFSGDGIRHTVTWRANSDVSALAGRPIALRFHLENAKLYSFVFGGEGP